MSKRTQCEVIRRVEDLLVSLDLSTQVLHLDAPPQAVLKDWFPDEHEEPSPDLFPTIAALRKAHPSDFVSASMLLAKAKQFNDSLYATVELLVQGRHRTTKQVQISERSFRYEVENRFASECWAKGKGQFLAKLYEQLGKQRTESEPETQALKSCRALLAASAVVGGQEVPAPVPEGTREIINQFLADPLCSKPVGFYSEDEQLAHIFRQDRLLQKSLESTQASLFRRTLETNTELANFYLGLMAFVQKLTNPFSTEKTHILADADPQTRPQQRSVVPPSRSPEAELAKILYGNLPIPTGFSLVDELVSRVRAGVLSLKPKDDSGWYDYQLHALEPLIIPEQTPEALKLTFSQDYRHELIKVFKGALALTRETHIKQLTPIPLGAALRPPVEIRPALRLEPTAEVYLRTARAYAFVRDVLDKSSDKLGFEWREARGVGTHSDGRLEKRLEFMISLFVGAHCAACRDLGLSMSDGVEKEFGINPAYAEGVFDAWASSCTTDPDLSKDQRMMVPVFFDTERKLAKAWVMLGYAQQPIEASFVEPPRLVSIRNRRGNPVERRIEFSAIRYSAAYPVTAELYVRHILNREEFRALCDRQSTIERLFETLSTEFPSDGASS